MTDESREPFDPSVYRNELRHHTLIDKLHQEFENGLCFVPDEDMDSGWRLAVDHKKLEADWRLEAFLELLSSRMQPAIKEYIRKHEEKKAIEKQSVLIGGPFDGEKIDVHKNGGTEARKIRNRWWAVYKRKPGEYGAKFVGFATSKANAMSYTLAHTTPASEFKAQPNVE